TGQFNITYADDTALDTIIFAVKNDSADSFTNISTFRVGAGTIAIDLAFNLSMSSTNGETFQWRFYGNDTSGNMNASDVFSFVVSDTVMSFSQNGTNFTSLRTGQNGMFNITAKDDDGLAMAIFSTRNRTEDVWFNFSAIAIGGTSYEIRYNYTVSAADGFTFQWKFYVNDTGGTMNESGTFNVRLNDTIAPYWAFNRTNFTSLRFNETGRFNITYVDNISLDTVIFAVKNDSNDAFTNITTFRVGSGTTLIDLAFNLSMSSTNGETFQWRFYGNDTSGNMNATDVFTLVVSDTIMTFAENGTNFTSIRTGENGMFNITAKDDDGLAMAIFSTRNTTSGIWFNFSAFAIGGTSYPIRYNYTVRAADGTAFQWKFYVNDSGGTMNESGTFAVRTNDTRAPQLFLDSPQNGTHVLLGAFINFTVNDSTAVGEAWYSRDTATGNFTFASSGQQYYLNTSGWALQQSTVTVYANDTSGNANGTAFIFTIVSVNISASLNSSNVLSLYDVVVSGRINVSNGTGVADQLVTVYVNTVLNSSNLYTNNSGHYNATIRAPFAAGSYPVLLNVSYGGFQWQQNATLNVTNARPYWAFNRTNFTAIKVHENGQLNITYADDVGLDTIILAVKNSSNALFTNISEARVRDALATDIAFNVTISSVSSQLFQWKFYGNDTAGNWNESDVFSIAINDTLPTFSQNGTNATTFRKNDNVIFNLTVSGESDGLAMFIFSLRNSTAVGWYNYSAVNISGHEREITAYNITVNHTISTNKTELVQWKFYVNDSGGVMYEFATHSFVTDFEAIFSRMGTNFTAINQTQNGMFNVTVNDEDGLAMYIFSLKNSTALDWYNFTARPIGGTTVELRENHTISSASGDLVSWKYYVNDSNGSMYASSTLSFLINDQTLAFTRLGTNFTQLRIGERGMFNVTATDLDGLAAYIFSLKNSTAGGWYNYSAVDISGTTLTINVNHTMNQTAGTVVEWKFYVNDTRSTMYESANQSFAIADTPLAFSQNGTNFTSIRQGDRGMFNMSVQDNDRIAMYIFSVKNSTGDGWYNYSAVFIGADAANISVNHTISSPEVSLVQWKYYANDSAGKMYESATHSFVVNDTRAPRISLSGISNASQVFVGDTINFVINDSTAVSRAWYSRDGGATNITLGNTSTTYFTNTSQWPFMTVDVYVYANDTYGFANSTRFSFNITGANITFSLPTSVGTGSAFAINGTARFGNGTNIGNQDVYVFVNKTFVMGNFKHFVDDVLANWSNGTLNNVSVGASVEINASASSIYGDGSDGAVTIASDNAIINNYTNLINQESAGDTQIAVKDGTQFANNDLILIIQMMDGVPNAGTHEFRRIRSGGGSTTLTLDRALQHTYGGIAEAQVIRVPEYTTLTIDSGSITAFPWNTTVGGVVVFKANTLVDINSGGYINASRTGFAGAGSPGQNPGYYRSSLGSGGGNGGGGGAGTDTCEASGSAGSAGTGTSAGSGGAAGSGAGGGGGGGGSNAVGGGGGGGGGSVGYANNHGQGGSGGPSASSGGTPTQYQQCGTSGGSGGGGAKDSANTTGTSGEFVLVMGGGAAHGAGGGGAGYSTSGGSGGSAAGTGGSSAWANGAGKDGTNGESGGGIVLIYAQEVDVGGKIDAVGGRGGAGGAGGNARVAGIGCSSGGGGGGGGTAGAAGGAIKIVADTIAAGTNKVNSSGGNGGAGGGGGICSGGAGSGGGAGTNGKVILVANSVSGSVSGGYNTSTTSTDGVIGIFTSQLFDARKNVIWTNFSMGANVPAGTNATYQLRSCDDAACSGESFVGPDGTGGSIFIANTTLLNSTIAPDNRYFQYRVLLNSTSPALTSSLLWANVTYSTGSAITDGTGSFDLTATAPILGGEYEVLVNLTYNGMEFRSNASLNTVELQVLRFEQNSTNFTTIRYQDHGLFTTKVSDRSGLSFALFSLKNSTNGAWYNYSGILLTGLYNATLSSNHSISTLKGETLEWRYYANNSGGIMYDSGIHYALVSDFNAAFALSTNFSSLRKNENGLFSATITEADGISAYIFSLKNSTNDAWYNYSAVPVGGVLAASVDANHTIGNNKSTIVSWKFYANDTNGTMYESAAQTFTVADYVAAFTQAGTNFTTIRLHERGMFNATASDGDNLATYIFALKNSSSADWLNYPAVPISGTAFNLSANHTISSTNGQTVQWRFIVNDTNGTSYTMGTQSFTMADTALAFSQNGTNFTSIKTNGNGMFNITVSDADGLAAYIFSLLNESNGNWFNYSAAALSGTGYDIRINHTISTATGKTVQWKFYVNDTGGTMYESATHSFVVSDSALLFSRNGTNFTAIRKQENGRFNITAEDADGLAAYIFSLLNESNGNWFNYSAAALSGTQALINASVTVNSNVSQTVHWKYYVNDSNGTMYESALQAFVVADTPATFSRAGTNTTLRRKLDNVMFNITVNDSDGLAMYIFALKNSTNEGWYNYSARSISGVGYDLRENHSISSNRSQTVQWQYYANDTNGTMYASGVQSFTVDDNTAAFTSIGTNFTSINQSQNAMFNATAADNDDLAMYIFSLKNSTALDWYNYSAAPIGGSSYELKVNHTISSLPYQTVQWKFYVNDTSGVMYESATRSFVVQDASLAFSQNGTNTTVVRRNDHVLFNITADDFDGIAMYIFSLKNATDKGWYNYSAINVSATGREVASLKISTNHTLGSIANEVVQWKYYVNDTVGLMYESATHTLVMNDTVLQFSQNGTNFTSIRTRDHALFNITVSGEGDGVAMYLFSWKNSSSNWYNYSAINVSGHPGEAAALNMTVNFSVNALSGDTVQWKFYVNDSAGIMYESSTHAFTVTEASAVFSQNGTNFTSIRRRDNGMFNITVTDPDGLAAYIFSLKNDTSTAWYNYSAVSISGLAYNISVNHSISTNRSQASQWKFYVNDTAGIMYESVTHAFVVADYISLFIQNQTNASSIRQHDNAQFRADVTDNDDLAMYIFSLKNASSGNWFNYSARGIGGSAAVLLENHTISSKISEIVQWNFYVNDSNGSMYELGAQSFTVADHRAAFTQNGTNFTAIRVHEQGMFNATVRDDEGLVSYIFSLKNASAADWYNYSAVVISGTEYNLSTNYTISSINGQTIQWKFYVNDTNSTMYEMAVQAAVVNDTVLNFTESRKNFTSIAAGNNALFNASITDADGLAMYIFALKNDSGEWFNYSAQNISGKEREVAAKAISMNFTLTSGLGTVLWQFYVNDSAGTMYASGAYGFTVEGTNTSFSQNGTNFTSIRVNERGMFNITLTDPDRLEYYIFSLRNSSSGSWLNYTAVNISGTVFTARTNHSISSTNTEVVQWKYYANDSSGIMAESPTHAFVVADTAASFTRIGTNATLWRRRDTIAFNATIEDPDGLAMYMFSIKNATNEAWYNYSAVNISGRTSYQLRENHSISSNKSQSVQWKFYVNETAGTMYESATQSFVVDDYAAAFLVIQKNATRVSANDNLEFSATVADSDELTMYLFSLKNSTSDNWYNYSARQVGGTEYTLRENHTISGGANQIVQWKFYVNDTNGTMYESATQSFVIDDTAAPQIFLVNPANGSQVFVGDFLNFTINDSSAVSVAWYSRDNGTTNATLGNFSTAYFTNTSGWAAAANQDVYIYANDTVGNAGFALFRLNITGVNISLTLYADTILAGETAVMLGSIDFSNGSKAGNVVFTVQVNRTRQYYNNTWDYLVSNSSLGSNDTQTNSTGQYRYQFNMSSVGRVEVLVNTTYRSIGIRANTTLIVRAVPFCGDGSCSGGESCNTCQADCGQCSGGAPAAPPAAPAAPAEAPAEEAPAEVAEEVPISEEPLPPVLEEPAEIAVEQEVAENVVVAPELAPQEIAQLQQEALVPISELPPVASIPAERIPRGPDGKPLQTTIDISQVKLETTLCVAEDYTITKDAGHQLQAQVPKGYAILAEPFSVSCADQFELVFAVSNNFLDVHALRCGGSGCFREEIREQEMLLCPGEVQQTEERELFTPDQFQFKISEVQGRLTPEALTVLSGEYAVEFSDDAIGIGVRLSQPKGAEPASRNPLAKIMGTPMVLKLTETGKRLPVKITLPYIRDNSINEDGIGIYALKDGNWTYVGGKVIKERTRVQAEIDDITKYAEGNDVHFAAIGELCETCLFSVFKHVYTPPIGSKDAVIMVHGLGSSPETFNQILKDIEATQQPWQAWTFGYPTTKRIEENAMEFANQMELYADYYDYIYIAAHSMGGLVTQQAVRYAYDENQKNPGRYRFVDKVKKIILVGTPNKGSPGAELLRDVVGIISSSKEARLFDPQSSGVYQLIEGKSIPQVPGIEYYVIAGTRPYELDLGIKKLSSAELFTPGEANDGIVSVESAQSVGELFVNNTCKNYWGINTTHTELLFNPVSRKIIERTIAYEILKDVQGTADKPLLGNLRYVQLQASCGEANYLLVGKRVDPNKAPDPTQCSCGNGFCNVDENEYSCPSDCAVIVSVENLVAILPLLLIVMALLGLIGSWKSIRNSRRYGVLSRWIILPLASISIGTWAYLKLIAIRNSGVAIGNLPIYAYIAIIVFFLLTIGFLFFAKLLVISPAARRRVFRRAAPRRIMWVTEVMRSFSHALDAVEGRLVKITAVRKTLLAVQQMERLIGHAVMPLLNALFGLIRIYRTRREIILVQQREGLHRMRQGMRMRLAIERRMSMLRKVWRAIIIKIKTSLFSARERVRVITRVLSRAFLHAIGLRKTKRDMTREIYQKRLAALARARAVRRDMLVRQRIAAAIAAGEELVGAGISKIIVAVRHMLSAVQRAGRESIALLRWARRAAVVMWIGGTVWLYWMLRDGVHKILHEAGLYRTPEERLARERKREAEQLAREEHAVAAQIAAEMRQERLERDAAEQQIAAEREALRRQMRAERAAFAAEEAAELQQERIPAWKAALERIRISRAERRAAQQRAAETHAVEHAWQEAERRVARFRAGIARQVHRENVRRMQLEADILAAQRKQPARGDGDLEHELARATATIREMYRKRREMLAAREKELSGKLAALKRGERR
ncbi:hypothetical protein HY491_02905, partial [Candidatus Woesearchaeota archaeon]|nr:hypothetical protein [Candidatus Woesearchaeota archaeon]